MMFLHHPLQEGPIIDCILVRSDVVLSDPMSTSFSRLYECRGKSHGFGLNFDPHQSLCQLLNTGPLSNRFYLSHGNASNGMSPCFFKSNHVRFLYTWAAMQSTIWRPTVVWSKSMIKLGLRISIKPVYNHILSLMIILLDRR